MPASSPREVGKRKITLVDAPVSGGVAGAKAGTLAVMVSCPKATYPQVEPILKTFGKLFYTGEKPGLAQIAKLGNNLLAAAAMVVSSEALAMGVKAGIDPQVMIDIINAGSGRNSATQDKFPRSILPGTFDFGFATGLSYKDVRLCVDEAEALGVPMVVGAAVRQMLAVTNAKFGPQSDFTHIAKVVEEWAGVEIRSQRKGSNKDGTGPAHDGRGLDVGTRRAAGAPAGPLGAGRDAGGPARPMRSPRPRTACSISWPAPSRHAICPGAGRRSPRPERSRAAPTSLPAARRSARPTRRSPTLALGHGLVREDMHAASICHHGVVIWPTLLALAQRTPSSGAALLVAAVVGYEAGGRIGRALMTADLARLYRPTGLVSPAGGGTRRRPRCCGSMMVRPPRPCRSLPIPRAG